MNRSIVLVGALCAASVSALAAAQQRPSAPPPEAIYWMSADTQTGMASGAEAVLGAVVPTPTLPLLVLLMLFPSAVHCAVAGFADNASRAKVISVKAAAPGARLILGDRYSERLIVLISFPVSW